MKYTPAQRSKIIRKPWGMADALRSKRLRDRIEARKARIEAYKDSLKAKDAAHTAKILETVTANCDRALDELTLDPSGKVEQRRISNAVDGRIGFSYRDHTYTYERTPCGSWGIKVDGFAVGATVNDPSEWAHDYIDTYITLANQKANSQ